MIGTNSVGCDSVATLDLTIDLTTSSNTIVTSCDYTWNGVVYTISGIYTWLSTNSVGCDSVATLDLTIDLTVVIQLLRVVIVILGIGLFILFRVFTHG